MFLVVDTELRPLISLRRFLVVPAQSETKVSNATMLGAGSRSARAPSVDPSARGDKPRERSAAQGGASSVENTQLTTPPTPGKWDSPASTEEVLLQVQSHLKRNSEVYLRGDSPEPDDLNEYRILDPSRGGSPTNEDEIVTAGEGQAPIHRRKYREESSCVCTGVEAPNGVFTNTRSRSFSSSTTIRQPE